MNSPTDDSMTLATLQLGTPARIQAIEGGTGLSRKLANLGLRIGSVIRVEHRRGRGLVVSSGPTRIALGGGITDKLRVVPIPLTPQTSESHDA